MAYLYCAEDGAQITDGMQPEEGELTVVTHGPLNRGDCRCDSCNRPLARDEKAYLLEFSHRMRFESQAADFFNERQARVRLIAVEGSKPDVIMYQPSSGQWVRREEWQDWAVPSIDQLKAALHRGRVGDDRAQNREIGIEHER